MQDITGKLAGATGVHPARINLVWSEEVIRNCENACEANVKPDSLLGVIVTPGDAGGKAVEQQKGAGGKCGAPLHK